MKIRFDRTHHPHGPGLVKLAVVLTLSSAVIQSAAAQTGEVVWSSFRYSFAIGSTMQPRDSDSGWSYDGPGCVSLVNGSDLFTLHVDLPEGSRVDFLRLFYYDTSASNSKAFLTTYDGAGGFEDLTSVDSAGDAGYGTTLSPYLGHVVDNSDQGYELIWVANTTGSSMRLCGMRIAYRLPI